MVESNSTVPMRPVSNALVPIHSNQRFFFTPISKIPLTKPNWLVDGILERETLAMIYGEAGCGKSFFALDLGACVAKGKPWQGLEVHQGGVLYMAGEGRDGLVRRAHAWGIANELEVPTSLCLSSRAIDLKGPELPEIQQAIEQINLENLQMIIVDTLSRHYLGDENTATDMAGFVQTLDRLKQMYGVTILVVHHSGKDPDRGPRGSSVLRGALDTEIYIKREKDNLVVKNTKQKDAEPFDPMSFQFNQVNMTDEDGEPITSGVLKQIVYVEKQKVETLGNNQMAFITCFARLVDETKSENRVEVKTLKDRLKEKLKKTDEQMNR